MSYESIGILAALILVITNLDILKKSKATYQIPAQGAYRRFLLALLIYYTIDVLWGFFDNFNLIAWMYFDTVLYFAAMGLVVFFWTKFVIGYLEDKNIFGIILLNTGRVFFILQIIGIIVNFFEPLLFWYDKSGNYEWGIGRYITLAIQILMFSLTSIYALFVTIKNKDSVRRRHLTIGAFGVCMVVLISIQIFNPLLPLYAVGCMLGSCLLHAFVIEDEKDEYHGKLEESLLREKQQKQELGETRHLAYTDPLTGVKSKHAYIETENRLDQRISDGTANEFAIAVFDLNGLKHVNDTMGHEEGDKFIMRASRIICNRFKRSPVYRIGGDEFVAIMDGEDFKNRYNLASAFDEHMIKNIRIGDVVIAMGMSDYVPGEDHEYRAVFERADQKMYLRKKELKEEEKNRAIKNQ